MARIFRLDSAAVLPGMPDPADETRRIADALDQSSNASATVVHAHGEHFDAIVLHQRRGIGSRQYQGRRSVIPQDQHIAISLTAKAPRPALPVARRPRTLRSFNFFSLAHHPS